MGVVIGRSEAGPEEEERIGKVLMEGAWFQPGRLHWQALPVDPR